MNRPFNEHWARKELLSPYHNGHHEAFIVCNGCYILRPLNMEFFLRTFGDQMHWGADFNPERFVCAHCGGRKIGFITGEFYLGDIRRVGDKIIGGGVPKGKVPIGRLLKRR